MYLWFFSLAKIWCYRIKIWSACNNIQWASCGGSYTYCLFFSMAYLSEKRHNRWLLERQLTNGNRLLTMWENIDRRKDFDILERQNDKLERQFGDVEEHWHLGKTEKKCLMNNNNKEISKEWVGAPNLETSSESMTPRGQTFTPSDRDIFAEKEISCVKCRRQMQS